MPLAHGLALVGYEDMGGGAFRVGDLVARPFTDDLEWGLGRIEGSLHNPEQTARIARLAVASLQQVPESENGITTCTDGRFPLLLLNSRLHPVRRQLLANNIGTGLMMAEMLGGDYYPDPTVPVVQRVEAVAENLVEAAEDPAAVEKQAEAFLIRLAAHEDCAGLGSLPIIMGNVVEFSRHPGLQSRTAQTLGSKFSSRTYHQLIHGLTHHLEGRPYQKYGADIVYQVVRKKTGNEGIMQLHNTGPDGVHGHQEKIILWLGESIPDLALNQRLLSEIGGGTGEAQAFGINQSEMQIVARAISKGDAELENKAMHAGTMGTHSGHGTLAVNMPGRIVERVT